MNFSTNWFHPTALTTKMIIEIETTNKIHLKNFCHTNSAAVKWPLEFENISQFYSTIESHWSMDILLNRPKQKKKKKAIKWTTPEHRSSNIQLFHIDPQNSVINLINGVVVVCFCYLLHLNLIDWFLES